MPLKHFYRAEACCILDQNDAGIWWGYIGIQPDHPAYENGFIRTMHGAIGKTIPPPAISESSSSATHMKRRWFGFEGSYSKDSTLETLKKIVDAIAQAPDESSQAKFLMI